MRRAVLLVLLFGGMAPAWGGNPLLPGIKGEDDRVAIESTEFPWRAIGRLNKATGGHCTATLIGPAKVLTAAHCLWNKRTQRYLPAESLHFVAGWSKGDYLAHSKASLLEASPAYRPGGTDLGNFAQDWAVVTLAEEVGGSLGHLSVEPLDAAGLKKLKDAKARFVLAGYGQDKAQILTAHSGCGLDGFVKGQALIAHSCDAVPGDSGSPIFHGEGKDFRIVAIHVGTVRRKDAPSLGLAVPVASVTPARR